MPIKDLGQYLTEMQAMEDELTQAHKTLETLAHARADAEYAMDEQAARALDTLRNDPAKSAKTVLSSSTLTSYYINGAIKGSKRQVTELKLNWDRCREQIRILTARLNSHQTQIRVEYPS